MIKKFQQILMPPLRLLKQSDLLQKSSNTMEVFQTSRDRSVVVEASAGTGKTFALEELVLELALKRCIIIGSETQTGM